MDREELKHDERLKAEVRMLRRALHAALDRIDELEREVAKAWDNLRDIDPGRV